MTWIKRAWEWLTVDPIERERRRLERELNAEIEKCVRRTKAVLQYNVPEHLTRKRIYILRKAEERLLPYRLRLDHMATTNSWVINRIYSSTGYVYPALSGTGWIV